MVTDKCEDRNRYRMLVETESLDNCIGLYNLGSRNSSTLNTMAVARVVSHNIGESITCPVTTNRTDWEALLDQLVLSRLGNRACLDCHKYFSDVGRHCFIGPECVEVCRCSHCGGTVSEPIACVEGIKI